MRLTGMLLNTEEDTTSRNIYKVGVSYLNIRIERDIGEFFFLDVRDLKTSDIPKLLDDIVLFAKGSILDARGVVTLQQALVNHGAKFKEMDEFWKKMGIPYRSITFHDFFRFKCDFGFLVT